MCVCLCVLAALHAHFLGIVWKSEDNFWSPPFPLRWGRVSSAAYSRLADQLQPVRLSILPCCVRVAGLTDRRSSAFLALLGSSGFCHKCFYLLDQLLGLRNKLHLPNSRLYIWHLTSICLFKKVCVYAWGYVHVSAVPIETRGIGSPWELVLWVVVSSQKWLLRTKLGASAVVALWTLHCWAISGPLLQFLKPIIFPFNVSRHQDLHLLLELNYSIWVIHF